MADEITEEVPSVTKTPAEPLLLAVEVDDRVGTLACVADRGKREVEIHISNGRTCTSASMPPVSAAILSEWLFRAVNAMPQEG